MQEEKITSRANPLLRHIRKLAASGAYRRKNGEFLCDGRKLLHEALQWNAAVTAVVAVEGEEVPAIEGARRVRVPEDVMRTIAPSETPQGVLLVCRMAEQTLPVHLEGSHYIVLDGVQDPGNLGTILRTADAFDCDGMFLVGDCADLYNPKTVRATMGACFRMPVYELEPEAMGELLERSGLPLYATALREDTLDIRTADLGRSAVAIGNEGRGVCDRVLAMSLRTLKIPMNPRCESLNAAAAAAVVLWEMAR